MNCPVCQTKLRFKGARGLVKITHNYHCSVCHKSFTVPVLQTTEVHVAIEDKVSVVPIDKKEGEFNWREWGDHLDEGQKLATKARWTQKSGEVRIPSSIYDVIVIKPLADTHFGSMGVDYPSFASFTDGVLNIPYLYIALVGDMTDNFAGFKSVMPVLAQGMPPAQQDKFLASWLEEIANKVLFACWGNHEEFEERSTGRNTVKDILAKSVIYFDGIGVANVKLGDETYRIAITHKTRNHSSINLTHGLKWMARRDFPDADLYLAGDKHDPAIEISQMAGKEKIYMLMGTLKKHDSYGERYFSYFSAQRDGAITINRRTHDIRAHACLEHALEYAKLANEKAVAE